MGRVRTLLLALPFLAPLALLPGVAHASNHSQPMRFTFYRHGSPAACVDKCKALIAAVGDITTQTPREFKKFIRGRDLAGAMVVLDSNGGSVHGAIELGREIRRLGLDTAVGRIAEVTKQADLSYAVISPRADCESMCAFVLFAGVHRLVPNEARVMVHQIWLGDRRDDPTAANYSAEDLVLVQRDIGRLAQYIAQMGVSIEILDLSLRIPPWEPMYAMSRDELQRMRVINDAPVTINIGASISAENATIKRVSNEAHVSEISERHWAMIDNSGAAALARRHPLTVRGQNIGHFDLLFSCGSSGDHFNVNYIEHRHQADDLPLSNALQTVSLRFENREAALEVMASTRHDTSGELVTLAHGSVPTGLLELFTAEGSHSLMVKTEGEQLTTNIRVGNTGVQQNMLQLASACAAKKDIHAELNITKTGNVASGSNVASGK